MALVTKFQQASDPSGHLLHKPIACTWKAFDIDGSRVLQLDTFGSAHRKNPGKQSQTIQLDANAAEELIAILRKTFPDVR